MHQSSNPLSVLYVLAMRPHVLKKIEKPARTWSQAWRPPSGGGPYDAQYAMGLCTEGTAEIREEIREEIRDGV
jgi:hypothetical protein